MFKFKHLSLDLISITLRYDDCIVGRIDEQIALLSWEENSKYYAIYTHIATDVSLINMNEIMNYAHNLSLIRNSYKGV